MLHTTEDKELFTKGPWEISWNTFEGGEAHGIYDSNSFDIRGTQIAIINELPGIDPTTDEKNGKANVKLIASSPDLYNALKDILDIATDRWRSLPANSHEKKCLKAAKEAINKAIK